MLDNDIDFLSDPVSLDVQPAMASEQWVRPSPPVDQQRSAGVMAKLLPTTGLLRYGSMFKTPSFPNIPVLLVDDSAFVRRMVRGMLEPVNLRYVIECRDGAEALLRLTQFRPGLIIIDWNLPILSAIDVLDVLRDPSRSNDADVPIIVMTSTPTQRTLAQAAARKVKTVLKKPFAPKALWQRIEHFYAADAPQIAANDGTGLLSSTHAVPMAAAAFGG
jgi:two-component system chemotaxis response regulator CheY